MAPYFEPRGPALREAAEGRVPQQRGVHLRGPPAGRSPRFRDLVYAKSDIICHVLETFYGKVLSTLGLFSAVL